MGCGFLKWASRKREALLRKSSGFHNPFLEWPAAVIRDNEKQVVNPGYHFLLFGFLDIEQVDTVI